MGGARQCPDVNDTQDPGPAPRVTALPPTSLLPAPSRNGGQAPRPPALWEHPTNKDTGLSGKMTPWDSPGSGRPHATRRPDSCSLLPLRTLRSYFSPISLFARDSTPDTCREPVPQDGHATPPSRVVTNHHCLTNDWRKRYDVASGIRVSLWLRAVCSLIRGFSLVDWLLGGRPAVTFRGHSGSLWRPLANGPVSESAARLSSPVQPWDGCSCSCS